jgi:hypothetical protein
VILLPILWLFAFPVFAYVVFRIGGRSGFWRRFVSYGIAATIGALLSVAVAILLIHFANDLINGSLELQRELSSKLGLSRVSNFIEPFMHYVIPAAVVYFGMGAGAFFVWRKQRRNEQ